MTWLVGAIGSLGMAAVFPELAGVWFAIIVLCVAAAVVVWLFNKPAFLVPPRYRAERGFLADLRGRLRARG